MHYQASGIPEIITGDVNADNEFTISDAVLLQKWLLIVPDTQLVNWKAEDICKDDRLDVLDLCLMKKAVKLQTVYLIKRENNCA
jgi:hypothetical protein